MTRIDGRKRIVVLHDGGEHWRWIAHHMPDVDWCFVAAPAGSGAIRNRGARIAATFRAARMAHKADLILSFDAGLAALLELARRALRVRTPHVSYFLNFDRLPTGLRQVRQARLFRTVNRFTVSSTMERQLYANHFGIDPARIDVLLWGVNAPVASDARPTGADYVCAVGGNARDYTSLMAVAAARPAIRFIVVVRPANLDGLTVPPNVETLCNIPYADAMAVVQGARLMALPLVATDTPCGHVTIVSAFYLGTPVVVTASSGIDDYVCNGETGLVAIPGSVESLGSAIDRVWNDPELAGQLCGAAKDFVEAHCTEVNYPPHVRKMLSAY